MGPDYERSVPKKADPPEDGARHDHIDDRLHKRIRRCYHEFGELRMNLVPGAIDKCLHDRLWDTTLRQRSVMLAAVAIDQRRAEFVLISCDIPNPVEASPSQCRVRARPRNKIGQDVPARVGLREGEGVLEKAHKLFWRIRFVERAAPGDIARVD